MEDDDQAMIDCLRDMAIHQHDPGRIGWFSLPREIRDKITLDVLAQDEVRTPNPKHMRLRHAVPKATHHFITKGLPDAISKRHETEEEKMRLRRIPRHLLHIYGRSLFQVLGDQFPPLRRGSGLQLLATCKQAYRECLDIFYSSNTFILLPGTVEHTREKFLKAIPPQYIQQIRHFVIEVGLQDLTPPIFAQCRQALKEFIAKDSSQVMVRSLPGGTVPLSAPYLGVLWGMFVKARLHRLWVQKFGITYRIASGEEDEERALAKGPLLMTVRMKGRMVTVGRVELGRCEEGGVPVEVMDLLGFAKAAVQREVEQKINEAGWRATRVWVEKGRWRDHVCG